MAVTLTVRPTSDLMNCVLTSPFFIFVVVVVVVEAGGCLG